MSPPCLVEPCLHGAEFTQWLMSNAWDGLGYIDHALGDDGLSIEQSHLAAFAPDGAALRCGWLNWAKPKSFDEIEGVRVALLTRFRNLGANSSG